jgi:hypothetical protein
MTFTPAAWQVATMLCENEFAFACGTDLFRNDGPLELGLISALGS